ncbi:MAG: 4-(cytidine 5'-diphospho)-2-C-methyl-D-erythritol kinase [Lachnospiraceae bacterium]|nr:4-(cytidine 5'-diphospho)-2-C-methyl-D-erythritol kinase [Lachnospiraceae bacterium]
MDKIIISAPAKLNLMLDIVGKRDDGYHELCTVMQMTALNDSLILEKRRQPGIRLSTSLPDLPDDSGNIAYRAAEFMIGAFGLKEGVSIEITKRIPIAAGMAGGSTDAAAVLLGMNRLFDLSLGTDQLMELGGKLGADVPFCVLKKTSLLSGRGDRAELIPSLPVCSIVVAKPAVQVSTAYVYAEYDRLKDVKHPDTDGFVRAMRAGDLAGIADKLGNVLEYVTAAQFPVINKLKADMKELGAAGTLMTGSGPTVFGLFEDKRTAARAARKIREEGAAGDVFLTEPYQQ